jgi:hypothetical protein
MMTKQHVLLASAVLSLVFTTVPIAERLHAKPLARPEMVQVVGPYTHAASGMVFPSAIGDVSRVSVFRYNDEETDVSAGYNLSTPTGRLVATVYIYPAPPLTSIGSPANVVSAARAKLCQDEFTSRKTEISQYNAGATLVAEQEISFRRGDGSFPGKKAVFEYEAPVGGQRQPVHSELYVFCYVGDRWAMEYRFTGPRGIDTAEISRFMDALPWTVRSAR